MYNEHKEAKKITKGKYYVYKGNDINVTMKSPFLKLNRPIIAHP